MHSYFKTYQKMKFQKVKFIFRNSFNKHDQIQNVNKCSYHKENDTFIYISNELTNFAKRKTLLFLRYVRY